MFHIGNMSNVLPGRYSVFLHSLHRPLLVTVASALVSQAVSMIVLWASPLPRDVVLEIYPVAGITCVIVAILVAFPISWRLQRERNRLAKTVHDLESAHIELDRRARTDPLTGMLNRGAFMSDVDESLLKRIGGAMLMIDADNFKIVNDTFGHSAGDEALRLVAETVIAGVRIGDICGRVGGEEFLVFVQATDTLSVVAIAERILAGVFNLNFEPEDGCRHQLSVSIGVAINSADQNAIAMMSIADRKMYEAKRGGRNQIAYSYGDPRASRVRLA